MSGGGRLWEVVEWAGVVLGTCTNAHIGGCMQEKVGPNAPCSRLEHECGGRAGLPQHGEGTSKAASISCVHTVLGHQELVDPVSVGANASMDPAPPPRTTVLACLVETIQPPSGRFHQQARSELASSRARA